VKFRDLAELAFRNLREALLRNSLTTMGVAVGVASLVAMLSLGVGLQELANKRFSNTGLFDAIIVTPNANPGGFGRPRRPGPDTSATRHPLDEQARHSIEQIPDVVEVNPEIRFPTEIQYEGNPYPTIVAGVPQSSRTNGAYDGMKGTFFSGPAADETILQIQFARELETQTDTLIGKQIVLRYAERQPLPPDQEHANSPATSSSDGFGIGSSGGFSVVPKEEKLRIIGIVETQPAAGFAGLGQGRVLIPLQVAEKLRAAQANDFREVLGAAPAKPTYQTLTVRVKGPPEVKQVEDAIRPMGFGTFSLLDATNNLRLVFAVFDLLLGIFGSLALVVASLGIVNTLVMAILERRREIGVLKALGAADSDIRALFFVEAGAMGLLGGVLGVSIGWLIGSAMNFGTNVYLRRQALPSITVSSVPWWMVAMAIGFSVGVSLAAGMYPASRAAKLSPVEALRYE
jgi:ABC-type antimicrobial peptide transport system permease subunit